MTTVLFPRSGHGAIEERYASWQAEMILRPQASEMLYYDPSMSAGDLAPEIETDEVLVVTDPLLLASSRLVSRLAQTRGDAVAAVPVTNASDHPEQQRPAAVPYMTLRELELITEALERQPADSIVVKWDSSDPGVYLCDARLLHDANEALANLLRGREVRISRNDYVHRWSSMRGQVRLDLLERISTDARSILEFGCGEAALGAALKARQSCRVVGVELDRAAAAIARKRIDDVYNVDVREIVRILDEKFDWIVGGDILEHLDDPWMFLADLRRIASPGGRLLLSLPNIANASVIADLLAGRFDYVYMGLTCAGHLRFFTRHSIEEMLHMSGWRPVEIIEQQLPVTPMATALMDALSASGVAFSQRDLTASGYYVIAENA
jgi:2-polyprenyl-3-methyl-5-hydroxy-6-metoxy-1,4-benzoquinol methylase